MQSLAAKIADIIFVYFLGLKPINVTFSIILY